MSGAGMGRGLRKLSSDFSTNYISEAGTQNANKDYFGYIPLDGYICWAVAETYDNDQVPSAKIAVETVLDLFSQNPTLSKRKLQSYIQEANRQLIAQSGRFQRKASIMVVVSDYKKMRYAQCGSCRLYMFRGGSIVMRSDDQSLLTHMIHEGKVADDGVQGIEESRNLFSFLGDKAAKIFVSKKVELLDEDVLLLSTWGIWDSLGSLEILDALEGAKSPESYLEELQELLLSKQEIGINDRSRKKRMKSLVHNYTAAAVFVNKTYVAVNNTGKYIKIALMIAIPLLIIGIIFSIVMYVQHVRRIAIIETIAQHEAQGDVHFADQNFSRAFVEYNSGLDESRSLRERRGRRGVQNEEIRESLSTRLRVAQLIVDGEEHFRASRYSEARDIFQLALHEARINPDLYDMLDSAALEARIDLSDDHIYISNLISLGELQADLGQYADALSNFNEARNLAVNIGYRAVLNDIRLRISEVTSRAIAEEDNRARLRTEAEQRAHDENILHIERNVLAGDSAAATGSFEEARLFYEQAVRDFIAAGEVMRASEIQHRIADMDRRQQNVEQEEIIGAIEMAVLEGERAAAEGDFERAVAIFEQAAWEFISAGETGRASALQYRIIDSNSRRRNDTRERLTREIEMSILDGDRALATGDYDTAIRIFEQAARDFIETSDIAQATAMRRRILEAETQRDVSARNILIDGIEITVQSAELAEAAGDYERAIQLLQMAMADFINAREPARASALRIRILDLETRARRVSHASSVSTVDAAVVDGDLAASRGDFEQAIRTLEQAARDYLALGETEKAAAVRARILELENERRELAENATMEGAQELVDRAEAAFDRGDYTESIRLFNQARNTFLALGRDSEARAMENRVRDANEGIVEAERERQISDAENLEQEGDRYLAANNFNRARERYRQASLAFQRLGLTDNVAAIQEKLRTVSEREEEAREEAEEAEFTRQVLAAQAIEQEGDRYLALENFDRARQLYRQAQTEFQRLGQATRVAAVQDKIRIANELEAAIRQGAAEAELARQIIAIQAIEHEGDRYLSLENFDRARQLYRQAQTEFQQLGLDTRVTALQEKIRIANELEAAVRERTEEVALAQQILVIQAIENEGDRYLALGNFERARQLYRQAQTAFQQIGQANRVAALQEKIQNANELEAAANQGVTEADVARQLAEAQNIENEGDRYLMLENFDRARAMYRQALEVYQRLGQANRVSVVHEKIRFANEQEEAARERDAEVELANRILEIQTIEQDGDRYLSLENFNRARAMYRQAQAAFQQLGLADRVIALQEKIRIADELEEAIRQGATEAERARQIIQAQLLESEGDRYLALENFSRAREMYRQSSDLFQQLGLADRTFAVQEKIRIANQREEELRQSAIEAEHARQVLQAQFLEQQGDWYLTLQDFDRARDLYRQAQLDFQRLGMPDRVLALQEKIRVANELEEEYRQNLAEEELAAQILAAQILEQDGDRYLELRDFDMAREMYRQAQSEFQRLGMPDRVLAIQDKIRIANELEALYREEQEENERLQTIFEAESAMSQGNRYMVLGNYELAIEQFERARDLYLQINDFASATDARDRLEDAEDALREQIRLEAVSIMSQGDTFMTNNNYTMALEYFTRARDLFLQINDSPSVSIAEGRIEDAQTQIRNQIRSQAESAISQGDIYMGFGDDEFILGEYATARDYFELALEQFIIARDLFITIDDSSAIAMAEARIEDAENAIYDAEANIPPIP